MSIQTRLAYAISFIFSPVGWALAFFAAAYYKNLFHNNLKIIIIFVTVGLLLPFTVYFLLLVTGKLTDPDISQRRERYLILAVINVCTIILLVFLKLSGLSELYRLLFTSYLILAASSLITLFYKISFHMTFTYTFAVLINYLYDFTIFYLLYLIVPIMFWSRLHLKRHTVSELVSALILDSVILYTSLFRQTL